MLVVDIMLIMLSLLLMSCLFMLCHHYVVLCYVEIRKVISFNVNVMFMCCYECWLDWSFCSYVISLNFNLGLIASLNFVIFIKMLGGDVLFIGMVLGGNNIYAMIRMLCYILMIVVNLMSVSLG